MTLQTSYKQHGVNPLSKRQIAEGTPIYAARSAPLVTLIGTAIATEQFHGELKVPAKYLKAGNTVRFKYLVRSTLAEGVQSWDIDAKWSTVSGAPTGDVTGTNVLSETVATPGADDMFYGTGFINIVTGGISGEVISFGEKYDEDADAVTAEAIRITADDCSLDHFFKVTGDATATSATLSFSLAYLEVEVWERLPVTSPSTMGIGNLDRKSMAEGLPVLRKEITTNPQITGATIATEQIFAELTLPLGEIAKVGRCIKFTAVVQSNQASANNWDTRVRLGAPGTITGGICAVHQNASPLLLEVSTIKGVIVTTSVGTLGAVDAASFGQNTTTADGTGLGNDTTDFNSPLSLILTGDPGAVDATQDHTLLHFSYEIMGLAPTPISQRNQ